MADHGDPRGPFGLAAMLRAGDGVDRDDAMARDLFTRAAEMGHPRAMAELAAMLRDGLGGPADPAGALRWTRTAAARGDGQAQMGVPT